MMGLRKGGVVSIPLTIHVLHGRTHMTAAITVVDLLIPHAAYPV